jgi:alanine-glyoxylate transaminase/serine-glyoxylate transaminase/serine-pyruvate transaminase
MSSKHVTSLNPAFIPGPTNIPEILRRAVDLPTMDHRSAAYAEMMAPIFDGLRYVFKSADAEMLVFPATGTASWEAAITNTLSPGDRVLAASHGMFSQRWIELCQRHGLEVQVIDSPWSEGSPVSTFAEALQADKGHAIKAVLVTHNETATGVRSDVAGVRRALDAAGHPALLFVDGVSSIASMDFRMDEWGVDAAVTGSQKGFMLPAGLAILGLSKKAMAACETAKCPRAYLDVRDMLAATAKGSFPYTPPTQLMSALATSIGMLREEGLDAVFARHHRMAEGVRRAVWGWGLDLCAVSPDLYSDTVSAIVVPEGCDGTAVVTRAAKVYGVAFGVGLGKVAGKVFRIGHLGMLSDVQALAGIATAEMVMADLGFPIRLGSGVAAAQDYYRSTTGAALATPSTAPAPVLAATA